MSPVGSKGTTPRTKKCPSKASVAARRRAAAAAASYPASEVDGASLLSVVDGPPADGRTSRASVTYDGLEFDTSIMDRFTPAGTATEGLKILSKEELRQLSHDQLTVRQGLISNEIDSLTTEFKQALADAQALLEMDS